MRIEAQTPWVTLVKMLQQAAALPLHSRTPPEWGRAVLTRPLELLADHALLEQKAATNAMELMTRWPGEWFPGWMEAMTSVARDEAAHLAQAVRLLIKRGGRLGRGHRNPYAQGLRALVRKGAENEIIDRLIVSALIEVRSCERFAVLAEVCEDKELAAFYGALFSSEMGHYKLFLKLAQKVGPRAAVMARWEQMLEAEARILGEQEPGPRMHSGI